MITGAADCGCCGQLLSLLQLDSIYLFLPFDAVDAQSVG